MRNTLIWINVFVLNFIFWYFIIRISGDTHLNQFLDTLIELGINDIQIAVALILGCFVPLDKAKEIISNFKK